MSLYTRILRIDIPKINGHAWPKAYADAVIPDTDVSLDSLSTHWSLSDKSEVIALVVPATDKLALSLDHTWSDGEGVFLTTTGTVPAGLSLTTPYYVVSSNPGAQTLKLSLTSGGVAEDITTVGTGTHTLKRIDADVMHYSDQRKWITGVDTADKRLRQIVWDEKAEGTIMQAEEGIAYTTVATLKVRLETWATWLSN